MPPVLDYEWDHVIDSTCYPTASPTPTSVGRVRLHLSVVSPIAVCGREGWCVSVCFNTLFISMYASVQAFLLLPCRHLRFTTTFLLSPSALLARTGATCHLPLPTLTHPTTHYAAPPKPHTALPANILTWPTPPYHPLYAFGVEVVDGVHGLHGVHGAGQGNAALPPHLPAYTFHAPIVS